MNTPAHLIFASAAFASPENRKVTWAALAGGLAPDLSLYLMAGFSLFILQLSPQTVFDELYFSDSWQAVFAIDNSFFVWIGIIGLGFLLGLRWLRAFGAGGFLHIALDFPLHHDDGRAHFWPLSDWVYESPVSYWDGNHFGHIVGPIEVALVVVATIYLVRKFNQSKFKYLFIGLAALQVAPFIMFSLMFS